MKSLFYQLLFVIPCVLFSQSFVGFKDNYTGVHSALLNPASIADTQYKLDINILSLSVLAGTDYVDVSGFNFFKDGINNKVTSLRDYITNYNTSNANDLYANVDVLLPSFLWNINRTSSLSINLRARAIANIYDVDGELYEDLDRLDFSGRSFTLENSINPTTPDPLDFTLRGSLQAYGFNELNFTYAFVKKHLYNRVVKYGITAKVITGIYATNLQFNNHTYTVDLQPNIRESIENGSVSFNDIRDDLTIDDITIAERKDYEVNITNNINPLKNISLGFDIGVEYEWRNNDRLVQTRDRKTGSIYYKKAPYKYKLGFSVTDIGYIKYSDVASVIEKGNNLNQDGTAPALSTYDFDFDDFVTVNKDTSETKDLRVALPTVLHTNADFNLNDFWYLNANVDISLNPKSQFNNAKYISNISVSPRYEEKRFSAYFPVTLNRLGIIKAGIGLRMGPFVLGSGSVFTNLPKGSNEGDFYFGMKTSIFSKRRTSEYQYSIKEQRKYIRL